MEDKFLHPRILEILGVEDEMELFLKIIIENGKFISHFYTLSFMGKKYDLVRCKFFLLAIIDKFENHSSIEIDLVIQKYFKKYETSYKFIKKCIDEEHDKAADDFKKSISQSLA